MDTVVLKRLGTSSLGSQYSKPPSTSQNLCVEIEKLRPGQPLGALES